MHTTRHTRIGAGLGAPVLVLTLALTLALTLGGCGNDPATAEPDTTGGSLDLQSAALTMTDPWVKSAPDGMTAAFGTLVNDGDEDIVVTAASSDIADAMELHETVQSDDGMAMQPKEGGFTVPAGGQRELVPGGDHLMVMDLLRPLKPGESVIFTLTLEDGSTTEIDGLVKRFTGADEEYQDGDMDDMDMGEDSGDS